MSQLCVGRGNETEGGNAHSALEREYSGKREVESEETG